MWARRALLLGVTLAFSLGVACATSVWDAPAAADAKPEPRTFASIAGVAGSSRLYMYGGFSHARNAWLGDVWSLALNASSTGWELVNVKPGDLASPLEHATLVSLGSSLLLVGGRLGNGWNDKLYLLDMSALQWVALSSTTTPAGPDSVPRLYWHSALSYTYGGRPRALLTGGLDANGSAVAAAYELQVDLGGGYTMTSMAPMPTPLFGHSLAPDPASAGQYVVASGGFTGGLPSGSAPREAVPPGLRAALEAAPGTIAGGSGSGFASGSGGGAAGLNMSYAVMRYDRAGGLGGAGGTGGWSRLGAGDMAMPRGAAFHSSWILGGRLYLYGGVHSLAAQGVGAADSVLGGLQAFALPTPPAAATLAFDPAAAAAATAAWGVARPGWVSGAAAWADVGNAAAPQLWLFGGWATPLPLPPWADSYLAPQDVSLTWRLDGGATTASAPAGGSSGSSTGAWLPPLQGGMAPRSGAMLAAVNVGGAHKLLSLGGRAATGWAAATTGGSRFLTNPLNLVFGADGDPRATAAAYQLTDLWLIDAVTGAREAVWLVNSTVVPATAACVPPYAAASLGGGGAAAANCTSLPFGSATAPAGGAPLWDRRLVESPMPVPSGGAAANGGGGNATGAAGGSNHAIYIHAAETAAVPGGAPSLTAGVWRLSISSLELPAAANAAAGLPAGRQAVYVATWQELTPAASPDPSPCYPRTLNGAAHLTSSSASALVTSASLGSSSGLGSSSVPGSSLSYVALFGGLLLSPSVGGGAADTSRLLSLTPTDSVCLLDVYYRRWLQPPVYPSGYFPEARYRVACASRPGLVNYTMSCFGGVSGSSGGLLGDAWLFSMQPGALPLPAAAVQLPVHFGTWALAPHNVTAVRPRARADHIMLPVRGPGLPGVNGSTYSPVMVYGGRLNASISAAAAAAPSGSSGGMSPLRRDLWLLETACADPDASSPNAVPSISRPPQTTQVWLGLMPIGSAAAAAAAAAVPGDAWAVAAATVSHNDTHVEVWMGVLPTGGAVADLKLIRMATTLDGCTSIRPNCTRASYLYDAVAPSCWAGTPAAALPVRVAAADSPLPATSLFAAGVALQLLAPDGVPVHFKNATYLSIQTPSGYLINDVRLPPDLPDATSLTLVAYGRPGVEVGRAPVTPPISTAPGNLQPTAVISFNRTSLTFSVRANGSALANATAELRVLYNGLYRKRCRVPSAIFGDCDTTVTDAKGSASFEVFPIPAAQVNLLSYVAMVTTPFNYGAYAVPLPSPYAVASGSLAATASSAGGGTVTLLPGGGASGTAVAYSIDIPTSLASPPPPDGRLSVTVTVTFRQSIGYSVLNLPTNRRWVASFYRRYSFGSLDPTPSLNITDTYSIASKAYARRLPPGEFLVWVTDSALPSRPMLETVRTLDAAAAAAAGGSTVVNLEVVLSTVTFRLFFSRVVVSPGAGFYVGASSVFVSLFTIPEDTTTAAAITVNGDAADANSTGGNGTTTAVATTASSPPPPVLTMGTGSTALGAPGVPWDSELTDGGLATFSVIPGIDYLAVFSYPSVILRGPVTITAPIVTSTLPGSGSSGGGSTTGGGAVFDYELPQALLCATGTTTLINQQRGRFPSDSLSTVVYGPGTTCSWVITTGQPIMNLLINYTGLAPGDYITLTTDTGFVARLPMPQLDSGSVFTIRMTASNVTIRFRGNNDNLMGTGPVVMWEGMSQRGSMPPQFIMMIAASSAAAGAMLLFLCLWHCVFRPVQLRRQAAAAAFAAAASAAAAGAAGAGAVGAAMRGAQGHRNRVPRRYLRMMDTSVYSAKEAAARAAAKAAKPSSTTAALVVAAPPPPEGADGGVAVGVPVPGATLPAVAGAADGVASKAGVAPSAVRAGAEMPPSPDGEANTVVVAGGNAEAIAAAAGITAAVAAAADAAAVTGATNATTVNSGSSSATGDGATTPPIEDDVDGADTCAICLCEFEDGERVKHLPCKHFYHIACIDTWLGRDITCPLCKDNVLEAMRALHGPLPPRTSGRTGRSGAAAAAAAADAEAEAAAAGAGGGGEAAAAVAGAGPGVGAPHAGHLELVVIVPSEGQAGTGDGGGDGAAGAGVGVGGGGAGHDAPGLPGSIDSYHGSLDAAGGARGASGGGAAPGAEGATAGGAAPTSVAAAAAAAAATAAAAAGGQEQSAISTAQSRELRPMRRNLSHDLGGEHDGTSTETDSDSDDDHGAAAAAAMGAAATVAAAAAAAPAGAGQPRNPPGAAPWAVAPPSPAGAGAGAASPHGRRNPHPLGHGHHHGRQVAPVPQRGAPPPPAPALAGNQLFAAPPPAAVQLAALGGGAGDPSTAGSPGSRPVAEHVQRSSSSSSTTAMRWMGGGGSQVVPMPAPQSPLGASAGGLGSVSGRYSSRVPPQARAQEAQMAAAAAALSAAAAATSGGSYSQGNPSSGPGGSAGGYSPLRLLEEASASAHAAAPNDPVLAAAAAAAAASMIHFRVHDNPLARSQNSLTAAADASSRAASSRGSGSNLPSPARPDFARASAAAAAVPGAPGAAAAAMLRSSASPSARSHGTSGSGVPAGHGGGVRAAGALAVPEVSGDDGDLLRTPSGQRAAGGGGGGGAGAGAGGAGGSTA